MRRVYRRRPRPVGFFRGYFPLVVVALTIDDVLLRYVPPHTEVVGITIVDFLKHFPNVKTKPFQVHAAAVLEELFRKYPTVPVP
jgi:hypothetical protein